VCDSIIVSSLFLSSRNISPRRPPPLLPLLPPPPPPLLHLSGTTAPLSGEHHLAQREKALVDTPRLPQLNALALRFLQALASRQIHERNLAVARRDVPRLVTNLFVTTIG
jgi:hypothetical protein